MALVMFLPRFSGASVDSMEAVDAVEATGVSTTFSSLATTTLSS